MCARELCQSEKSRALQLILRSLAQCRKRSPEPWALCDSEVGSIARLHRSTIRGSDRCLHGVRGQRLSRTSPTSGLRHSRRVALRRARREIARAAQRLPNRQYKGLGVLTRSTLETNSRVRRKRAYSAQRESRKVTHLPKVH